MSDDKRKVSTDALETLGMIIDETQKRDAIHLAVIPMVAQQFLLAGDHVDSEGNRSTPTISPLRDPPVGIVDPFLEKKQQGIDPTFWYSVKPGEWFWLVIYPRQIDSLRHVWTHPDFPDYDGGKKIDKFDNTYFLNIDKSRKWLQDYVDEINEWDSCPIKITYYELLQSAKEWIDSGKFFDFGLNNEDLNKDFWNHYEVVTGKKIDESKKENFFGCCC